MGKKGSSTKKGPMVAVSSHLRMKPAASITLREESRGKQHKPVSVKSMLKFDHIKNLALWAGVKAPSLSAFFGHRLAATAETLDAPQDPSLFSCQRCESILQPGHNCTVRIQKNKSKVQWKRKKSNFCMKNSVVYSCHVCSHQNLKKGTSKGYMKELCPPKIKPVERSNPMKLTTQMDSKPAIVTEISNDIVKMDSITPEIKEDSPSIHTPATPATIGTTLLDSKRRKRSRSGAKKTAESGGDCVAVGNAANSSINKQRKRKSWTSLKEIAERNEQEHRNGLNKMAAIPFIL